MVAEKITQQTQPPLKETHYHPEGMLGSSFLQNAVQVGSRGARTLEEEALERPDSEALRRALDAMRIQLEEETRRYERVLLLSMTEASALRERLGRCAGAVVDSCSAGRRGGVSAGKELLPDAAAGPPSAARCSAARPVLQDEEEEDDRRTSSCPSLARRPAFGLPSTSRFAKEKAWLESRLRRIDAGLPGGPHLSCDLSTVLLSGRGQGGDEGGSSVLGEGEKAAASAAAAALQARLRTIEAELRHLLGGDREGEQEESWEAELEADSSTWHPHDWRRRRHRLGPDSAGMMESGTTSSAPSPGLAQQQHAMMEGTEEEALARAPGAFEPRGGSAGTVAEPAGNAAAAAKPPSEYDRGVAEVLQVQQQLDLRRDRIKRLWPEWEQEAPGSAGDAAVVSARTQG